MNNREKLITYLKKYNEVFIVEKESLVIMTDSPLYIYVSFTDESVKVKGKLMKWNFLTGAMKVSIENLYLYTSMVPFFGILISFLILIFYEFKNKVINLNYLAFLICGYIVLFCWTSLSYLNIKIMFENKKQQLINWIG